MRPHNIAEWTHREMEMLLHSVARYTRFVRSTKFTLAALALLLTCMVLFYPLLHKESAGVRIAFTSIEKGVSSPTQMLNAQFHGLDKDNQPFNLLAKTATQRDENTLDLDKVAGDISLNTGKWLSMASNTGIFHMQERLLDLKGAIEMFDDEGYEFRTEAMHVDIGKKTAVTTVHVEGQGPLGKLNAAGAVADGNLGTINFTGPVNVTLYPEHADKTQKAAQ